ncbi:MAG TPA: SpoIIE family protein phosphatase [Terracidiphilus sp.]|nr:SpoIIE family protein phosphatase [Terracidiphilus sp.]
MRKVRLPTVLLVALGVCSASIAQPAPAAPASSAERASVPVQFDHLPPALVPFNNGWLYRAGDSLAWASPDSSDDGWQPVTLDKQSPGKQNAWHWYRIRIDLPAGHPPLALLLVPQDSGGFETYLNGQRIGDSGFQSFWRIGASLGTAVPLPSSAGPAVVDLRVHYPDAFGWDWKTGISASLGSNKAVQDEIHSLRSHALVDTLPSAFINLALVLAGIAVLLLFRAQPASREYFWLGLYLLFVGTSFGPYSAVHSALLPGSVNLFYCDPIIFVFAVAQIEFTFAFVHRPVNRFWRFYELLLLGCLVCTVLFISHILPTSVYFLIESLAVIPPAVALPFVLFFWYRRGNPEAGWLILPSLFPAFGVAITNIGPVTDPFHLNFPAQPVPFHLWGLAPVYVYDLADGIFLLAIGIVIFFRFTRVSRQQARAAAEFEAARAVQQVLVPVENPSIPGFRIDGLYLPAGEVGGDFYQVVPTPSGGVLAVVGDVSGKGMPAAMTVSLLIGTFRTLAHYTQSPAEILLAMNQRMIARLHGGFTTCLVLRVDCDGTLTVANAGHIPPYMDGREQTLDYGLPLGLDEHAAYIETTLALRAGAQVTLLTDGVIEAQSSTGELLGFERSAVLSTQPAEAIARAAQSFGQKDDITVLTLQFAPA